MSTPVIVLRGLPGSGKTTTSALLRDRLGTAVRVSNDDIRYLAKPRDFSRLSLEASERACIDLAVSYARSGFIPVADGVFYDREFLDAVSWELALQDISMEVFTLVGDIGDLLHRNQCREELSQLPASRIRQLHRGFLAGGTAVSINDKLPEEVAEDVHELITQSRVDGGHRRERAGIDVLFLRHGEAESPREPTIDPSTMPLSTRGRAQALAAQRAVQRFEPDAVYASDSCSAVETAQVAVQSTGQPVEAVADLRECHVTSDAESPAPDIGAQRGETDRIVMGGKDSQKSTEAEKVEAAATRMMEFVQGLAARSGGPRRILFVSHSGPHTWLVCRILGAPIGSGPVIDLEYAAFSRFHFSRDHGPGSIDFINRHASGINP
ncbi:histidine phosphatase family protein [Haloglycomyces albus]|uniref:histidine phosphatase family protein n=1 Tax=Haloglycomyces albus TaxID=526067 RepID=UPI00046CC0CD|nr:histidine phosphatase family protein [Haloglycomyces albus]